MKKLNKTLSTISLIAMILFVPFSAKANDLNYAASLINSAQDCETKASVAAEAMYVYQMGESIEDAYALVEHLRNRVGDSHTEMLKAQLKEVYAAKYHISSMQSQKEQIAMRYGTEIGEKCQMQIFFKAFGG